MARKTVIVSDMSGTEIEEGKGALVTIKYEDQRKQNRQLDVTAEEADKMGGRVVARRGRRPKTAEAAAS